MTEEDYGDGREFDRPEKAIPEEHFPPTIHNILEGLEDGRKRALFILITFLHTVGYGWNEIESRVLEWNERNTEPLRESYVKSQLNWHRKRDKQVPPPNYDAEGYYREMQVYEGDEMEEKVFNPVDYAFRKAENSDGDGGEEFSCPFCGKSFSSKQEKAVHVAEEHVDEERAIPRKKRSSRKYTDITEQWKKKGEEGKGSRGGGE